MNIRLTRFIIVISSFALAAIFASKTAIVAQSSSIKFGTFTPTSSQSQQQPTQTRHQQSSPTSARPTNTISNPPDGVACIDNYRPGGNNDRSRSYVYGMLLKLHKESSLDVRMKKADEDVVRLAQMNYHLFGRLPSTDDPVAITEMLGQQHSRNINYFYMKGEIRLLGTMGQTFDELENALLSLDCEARLALIPSKSSSPLIVFTPKKTAMKIRIANSISRTNPETRKNTWTFTADKTGSLHFPKTTVGSIRYDFYPKYVYTPNYGYIVEENDFKKILGKLINRIHLTPFAEDIQDYMSEKLPQAPYYILSLYPKEAADKALVWYISPRPDREYKYIFYIRPLIDPIDIKPLDESLLKDLVFHKQGLTVVDYSVLIDY